jgi:glutaredoxin domain-containing cysteine-rich protein 1
LSGHCSPCGGSGDSGTCSDAEGNVNSLISESPPPLPPKTYKLKMDSLKLSESTCSDASSASSSSTDSIQYHHQLISPELIRSLDKEESRTFVLPTSLLRDIRNHSLSYHRNTDDDGDGDGEEEAEDYEEEIKSENEDELNYSDIVICNEIENNSNSKNNRSDNENEFYDDDKFYKFHINENFTETSIVDGHAIHEESDESFAGFKDLRSGSSTIRSAKGTIRGVKNRVRNGIATFLQMQQTTVKVCMKIIIILLSTHYSSSLTEKQVTSQCGIATVFLACA